MLSAHGSEQSDLDPASFVDPNRWRGEASATAATAAAAAARATRSIRARPLPPLPAMPLPTMPLPTMPLPVMPLPATPLPAMPPPAPRARVRGRGNAVWPRAGQVVRGPCLRPSGQRVQDHALASAPVAKKAAGQEQVAIDNDEELVMSGPRERPPDESIGLSVEQQTQMGYLEKVLKWNVQVHPPRLPDDS